MNSSTSKKESTVKQYEKLVMSIAQKFASRAELADICQAGYVGLLKAYEKFDESLGYAFTTYAVPLIIGEIKMYLRSNEAHHLPRSIRETAQKCFKAQEELRQKLLRDPSVRELSEYMGIDVSDVALALEAYTKPISLDSTTSPDDTTSLLEMTPDLRSDQIDDLIVDSLSLKQALSVLDEDEKILFDLRFKRQLSQVNTALVMKLSQSTVHRMEKGAISKLKSYLAN